MCRLQALKDEGHEMPMLEGILGLTSWRAGRMSSIERYVEHRQH